MIPRIAVAVTAALTLTAPGVLAACPPLSVKPSSYAKPPPTKTRADDCVDLNGVAQIGAGIVAAEPAPSKKTGYAPPSEKPYEGPTLGLTKPEPGVRPAPTVGYHWNLE